MICLKKRGYYFFIDALIGSIIITISLMMLLGGKSDSTKIQYNYEMAEEYSSFILNTKINEVTNPYVNNLIVSGVINDTSLTIVEQIDLFYLNNDLVHARNMVQNLTTSIVLEKYGFSYNMIYNGVTTNIYNKSIIPIEEAKIVIASRKITFLQVNSTTLFGPAIVEIKTWV